MSQTIDEVKTELEAAQSALDAALRAWDESVSELWRTSLAPVGGRQAARQIERAASSVRKNRETLKLLLIP